MSDQNEMLRLLVENDRRLSQTETKEVPLAGSGTAFPSAPPTGFRFFRTDLGFDCYYDGTRWLTIEEYVAPLAYGVSLSVTYAGVQNEARSANVRTDYACYFTRGQIPITTGATNNGTNYLSYTVASSAGTLWTFNTSADGTNTLVLKTTTSFSNNPQQPTNSVVGLDIAVGAGAPSAQTVRPGMLWYRLVIT